MKMKITRKIDTANAKYDLQELSEAQFNVITRAYEHYMYYVRHCPPSEDDELWNKITAMRESAITVIS